MARRKLLLCFDAFGTLFAPKSPVPEQYAHVARQFGLDVSPSQIETAFKTAYKSHSKAHPNYGKASGMGAENWWTNVIKDTFTPLTTSPLPPLLAPKLLHRFSSAEGYAILSPSLPSLLQNLKSHPSFTQVLIGVVTNSDDRVPDVLSSLGFCVSPLRYGGDPAVEMGMDMDVTGEYDIDFHCMSYNVGYAKPNKRIFDAAEEMAGRIGGDDGCWLKVFVGDEMVNDVEGSTNAGWNAVFVGEVEEGKGLRDLEDVERFEVGGTERARVGRVEGLLAWLVR
ncbi:hypothetical protein OQA88_5621 [Cercophora sp. LCS_1]